MFHDNSSICVLLIAGISANRIKMRQVLPQYEKGNLFLFDSRIGRFRDKIADLRGLNMDVCVLPYANHGKSEVCPGSYFTSYPFLLYDRMFSFEIFEQNLFIVIYEHTFIC